MEVVLANLAKQTPEDILKALQSGDAAIDTKAKEGRDKDLFELKTESILRSIDYSHSNLSPDSQQLLLCLAPFAGIIFHGEIDTYINCLKEQSVLANLPFDRWQEVMREAQNWGLLTPDPINSAYVYLQPIFPYFLRNRLKEEGRTEMREAIETAFREYYTRLSHGYYGLFDSEDPEWRQLGQLLVGLEYENLATALNLALEAQVSIFYLSGTLQRYLRVIGDDQRALELEQMVLARLETFSTEKLEGELGVELITVIGTIGEIQTDLKRYAEAEVSYQKALSTWSGHKDSDDAAGKRIITNLYESLGIVAMEQRKFERAKQYFQQVLELKIKDDNRHKQADTYHQLGNLAKEQREFEQAEQYYHQALRVDLEFNNHSGQANTYHQLGILAQEQRKFERAKQYFLQALELEIKDDNRHEQADTYFQLGTLAREQQHLQQAERYLQQALQIYIEFGDHDKQAMTYHSLGVLAHFKDQFEQAEQYYLQALELEIEHNDRYGFSRTYHQLGSVAQAMGKFEQAEQYSLQALQIDIENDDRYGQANCYGLLGMLASKQRQWQQAREYFLRALEIFGKYEDNYSIDEVLEELAHLWKASGDTTIPAEVARVRGATVRAAEKLLRKVLKKK